MYAVDIQGLSKSYGSHVGCRAIELKVPHGHVFGLLGPNGAGKSTLVKVLVGLLYPTAGRAWLLGHPLGDVSVRRRLGYLPENFRYHDWLTGMELLCFHAALCGIPAPWRRRRAEEVLDLVGLSTHEKARIRTYSKGMQQRIGVACALIGNPDLVFLDEPTSALDPLGRRDMRELIVRLREQGKTVFLNSHLLGEVEAVCETVAIIHRGEVVAQGNLDDLLGPTMEVEMEIEHLTPELEQALRNASAGYAQNGSRLVLKVRTRDDIPHLAQTVVGGGGRLLALIPRQRSLEDVFIEVVKSASRGPAPPPPNFAQQSEAAKEDAACS